MKGLPSSVWISGLSRTDTLSQIRGVGRYTKGLLAAFSDITPTDVATNRLIAIEPFFNVLTPPSFSIFSQRDRKRVAVVHDVIPLEFRTQYPLGLRGNINLTLNRLLLNAYHHVVTDSETSRGAISKYLSIPIEKITVIFPYSTLQDPLIQSETTLLPSNIKPYEYMLYVGDVNWHKNIVRLAQIVIAQGKTLVCVGGAFTQFTTSHPWQEHHREFQKLAQENPQRIVCVGYVNDQVLASLYRFASANVLISHNEGFGYSYIEAGFFGTPSILSDKPIFREISNGFGAIFVDPENMAQIGNAMGHIYSNRAQRDLLGGQAKERSGMFSRAKFREDWLHLINHI